MANYQGCRYYQDNNINSEYIVKKHTCRKRIHSRYGNNKCAFWTEVWIQTPRVIHPKCRIAELKIRKLRVNLIFIILTPLPKTLSITKAVQGR